jgi:hypothetical protein
LAVDDQPALDRARGKCGQRRPERDRAVQDVRGHDRLSALRRPAVDELQRSAIGADCATEIVARAHATRELDEHLRVGVQGDDTVGTAGRVRGDHAGCVR